MTIGMTEDSLQGVIEFLSRKSENCTGKPTLPFISKHYHNQENSLRLFWEAMEDTVLWFIQHGFQHYSPLPFLLKKIDFPAFLRARGCCTTEFWPLKQKYHVASAASSLSVFFCLLCWLDA